MTRQLPHDVVDFELGVVGEEVREQRVIGFGQHHHRVYALYFLQDGIARKKTFQQCQIIGLLAGG